MKLVEVDCHKVTLTGITLNSSLTLANPHQILAVMFQFQSRPPYFEIEPERGMILGEDKKFIKVRIKPQYRIQAEHIEKGQNVLVMRATYYCEYNRKRLERDGLGGWETISHQLQEMSLPIILSFQAEVEKLKESMKREKSFKHSRKQNSFEKFRDSSIKKTKDPKLNEDLQFLFRNEEYGRLAKEGKVNHQDTSKPITINQSAVKKSGQLVVPEMYGSRTESDVQEMIESKVRKIGSKQSLEGPVVMGKNRGIELVLLAVIAALSLAVGEVFGSFLKA